MSSNTKEHLCIGRDLCFVVIDGKAVIVTHAGDNVMTLDDLGGIAEWLAEAWTAVAGEEYKPVAISERGYVADEGGVAFRNSIDGDGVILPGDRYPRVKYGIYESASKELVDSVKLERDCE